MPRTQVVRAAAVPGADMLCARQVDVVDQQVEAGSVPSSAAHLLGGAQF